MGKIRIKTLGDDTLEKKQKHEAKNRAEVKRAEKKTDEKSATTETQKENETQNNSRVSDKFSASVVVEKPSGSETKQKSKYEVKAPKHQHSRKYQIALKTVDKTKNYALNEALMLLTQLKRAHFDESVEIHLNTIESGISGNVILPHGTGKKIRVVIVNQSQDPKAIEELIKKVESGMIDFDVLLATPDSMPRIARIARFLGPRGLMPNPKNGTVTQKPQDIAKNYENGRINFKTEAKFPLLHLTVGKISFGETKLSENIKAAIEAIQIKNIRSITLKSTMSPAIKLATSDFS
jgi:large subunit ribosomal protein L1